MRSLLAVPLYDRGVNDTWWFDAVKDAKLAGK